MSWTLTKTDSSTVPIHVTKADFSTARNNQPTKAAGGVTWEPTGDNERDPIPVRFVLQVTGTNTNNAATIMDDLLTDFRDSVDVRYTEASTTYKLNILSVASFRRVLIGRFTYAVTVLIIPDGYWTLVI